MKKEAKKKVPDTVKKTLEKVVKALETDDMLKDITQEEVNEKTNLESIENSQAV